MGYKKESHGKDQRTDWISFPDDPKVDETSTQDFDIWNDDLDQRADDLLHVSQLDAAIRKLRLLADAEIERRQKAEQKPVPLWLRVLLHSPKNKKQTLLYHVVFGGLMILAVILFFFSLKLIS